MDLRWAPALASALGAVLTGLLHRSMLRCGVLLALELARTYEVFAPPEPPVGKRKSKTTRSTGKTASKATRRVSKKTAGPARKPKKSSAQSTTPAARAGRTAKKVTKKVVRTTATKVAKKPARKTTKTAGNTAAKPASKAKTRSHSRASSTETATALVTVQWGGQLIELMEEGKRIPKTKLTKRELRSFSEMLLAKRRELVGNMENLTNDAFSGNQAASGTSSMPMHMADVGTDNWEQEFTLGLIESERTLVREIDEALDRIQDRTYGICLATHRPIDKTRLRAKPWAKYCIEYARLRELGRVP